MLCSHCNRNNHTIDTCYFKHGFPPGYRTRNQGSTTMQITSINQDSGLKHDAVPLSNSQYQKEQNLALSREHYQYLISLLHANKQDHNSNVSSFTKPSTSDSTQYVVSSITPSGIPLTSSFLWILDSGASDHVCPYIHFFSTYKKINPITVKLPNGVVLYAHYSGSIFLNSDFCLHDVLHIPDFHFNLISVSKLTHTLHCNLIFSSNSRVIQDLASKRTIGHADVHHNLYLIQHTPTPLFNNTQLLSNTVFNSVTHVNNTIHKNPSFDLWHYRLGHPSYDVLHTLCKQFPYIVTNKNLICDSCHFAK